MLIRKGVGIIERALGILVLKRAYHQKGDGRIKKEYERIKKWVGRIKKLLKLLEMDGFV